MTTIDDVQAAAKSAYEAVSGTVDEDYWLRSVAVRGRYERKIIAAIETLKSRGWTPPNKKARPVRSVAG